MGFKRVAQGGASRQICGSGHTAGEYEPFGLREVNVGDTCIGHNGDAVCAGNLRCVFDGYGEDVHSCAAHNVDSCQGFDFFKTRGKKNVGSCHKGWF